MSLAKLVYWVGCEREVTVVVVYVKKHNACDLIIILLLVYNNALRIFELDINETIVVNL
jgi:hypothetical protein